MTTNNVHTRMKSKKANRLARRPLQLDLQRLESRTLLAGFSMVFASDPQFDWWRGGKDPSCNDGVNEGCVESQAVRTNTGMRQAMKELEHSPLAWPEVPAIRKGAGSSIPQPSGVIVNGDLTAFFHKDEFEDFKEVYETTLGYTLYPGLGNHDYKNNYLNCWRSLGDTDEIDPNYCAKKALGYIHSSVSNLPNVVNYDLTTLSNNDSFSTAGSLSYSFDVGDYHFVQLHNRPDYAVEFPDYGPEGHKVTPSYQWLEQDLDAATAAGKLSIINMHDALSSSSDSPKVVVANRAGYVANVNVVSFKGADQIQRDSSGNLAVRQSKTMRGIVSNPDRLLVEFKNPLIEFETLSYQGEAAKQSHCFVLEGLLGTEEVTEVPCGFTSNTAVVDQPEFHNAIQGQNVVGIFAGHLHERFGEQTTLSTQHNAWNQAFPNMPLFLSGSAECETFLLAEFQPTFFNLGVVSSRGGSPQLITSPQACDASAANWSDGTFYANENPTTLRTYSINTILAPTAAFVASRLVSEGDLATVQFENQTDPSGDVSHLHYSFDFGADGTFEIGDGATYSGSVPQAAAEVPNSHLVNGTHDFKVLGRIFNSKGFSSEYETSITVVNVEPKLENLQITNPIGVNQTATLSGTIIDPGVEDSFTLYVDWNDKKPVEQFTYPAGTTNFTALHQYRAIKSGERMIRVEVVDSDNGRHRTNIPTVFDGEPPTLEGTPEDLTVEATDPTGAAVHYSSPSARDDFDPNPIVGCFPVPTGIFPLGETTVVCEASDLAGNLSEASFNVTVVDTTAPRLTQPHDVIVTAPNAAGAHVTFEPPVATDLVDGATDVSCSETSGSLFPVGVHAVHCGTQDQSDNSSEVSFTIRVDAPLLTDNLTVIQTFAFLLIKGDREDNSLIVEQIGKRQLRISGINGTTVDGSPEPLVVAVTKTMPIRVSTLGGDDDLQIGKVSRDLQIFAGPGDDTLSISTVRTGKATVNTGSGSDEVTIRNAVLDRDYRLLTFGGADRVVVDNSRFRGKAILSTGGGNDFIAIDDSIFHNMLAIQASKGNDRLEVERSELPTGKKTTANSKVQIRLTAGVDHVLIGRPGESGNSFIMNGRRPLLIDGGLDLDTLEIGGLDDRNHHGNRFSSKRAVRGFERIT